MGGKRGEVGPLGCTRVDGSGRLFCVHAFNAPSAVTLGNNILAALPAHWTQNQSSRRWRLGCRLAIAVPPLVLGAFQYQLAIVIQFTGLTGNDHARRP